MYILIIGKIYYIGGVTQIFTVKNINEEVDCFIHNITHYHRHQHCVSSIYYKKHRSILEDGYE